MLILVIFVFILVLAIAMFSLGYTRMIGAHNEQKTAIESAALAAARDISRIVINDPNFGYIGLSDSAPVGKQLLAGDGYPLEVRSINTIFATIRLDMIVADRLNNDVMKQLCDRDYSAAVAAKAALADVVKSSIQKGVKNTDLDGSQFSVYADALSAYESNVVRMTGGAGSASLKPDSLKLTLGFESGLGTTTKFPQPQSAAVVTDGQRINEVYKAFVNIPYGRYPFDFTPCDKDVELVHLQSFTTDSTRFPIGAIADVVKCDADEVIVTSHAQNGAPRTDVLHAAACANPSSLDFTDPHPGSMVFAFPTGMFPELGKPGDIFDNLQITKSPTDTLTSPGSNDWPQGNLSDASVLSTHPLFGDLLAVATYDWLRRSGPYVDLTSLINVLNGPFDSSVNASTPQQISLEVQPNGQIFQKAEAMDPTLGLPVSQKQYRGVTGLAVASANKKYYDVAIKDMCYSLGTVNGGKHAGEPFLPSNSTEPTPPTNTQIEDNTKLTMLFPSGAATVRPTYNSPNVAVEIRFRAH